MLKYNLKNRPVKATPQEYERWIKGLENELRQIRRKWELVVEADPTIYSKTALTDVKEILGDE